MTKTSRVAIFVLVAVVILVAGYWYWQSTQETPTPETINFNNFVDSAQVITDSATQGALPSLDIQANPLDAVPDINPVTKTNPYSAIKTNPFR